MKIAKKLVGIVLIGVLALSLFGCNVTQDGPGGSTIDLSGRSKRFTLCYYEGGYGVEWLQAVINDYMLNVNTDVAITLKSSTDNESTREKIKAKTGTYDLYLLEVDMFNSQNVLEDLTDWLEMEVPGEPGVKVKDKIPEKWIDYYTEGDAIYQMPATNFLGWNWSYNKTLLDETLGEGNYKLPNTTDEMFALGKELFNHNVYLTTFVGTDTTGGADYLRYCFEVWFAQMTGMEGYNHYFNCEYNNNGTYEIATDAPRNIEENRNAIEKTYAVAQTLCQGANGVEFVHGKCESLNFIDAQFLLRQGTFRGVADYPIAFYYNTAAGEREMAPYIADGIIPEQDVRMMKMPLISAITDRTETINDDATLSAVVNYVDGTLQKAPDGVSEEDIEIVREARSMMAELVCREFVITKDAQNKEEIKEFLAYLTSDRAQKIAAQNCDGLPVLNYGYVPTEEDMGFAVSEYARTAHEIASQATIVDIAKFDKPVGHFMGMSWYRDNTTSGGTLCKNLYTRQALGADKIYQSTYDSFASLWKDRMEQYAAR